MRVRGVDDEHGVVDERSVRRLRDAAALVVRRHQHMVARAVGRPQLWRRGLDRVHRRRTPRLHPHQAVPWERRHAQRIRRHRQQEGVGRPRIARGEWAVPHVAQQVPLHGVAAVEVRGEQREQPHRRHGAWQRVHIDAQRRRQRRQRGAQRGRVSIATLSCERPHQVLWSSGGASQLGVHIVRCATAARRAWPAAACAQRRSSVGRPYSSSPA